MSELFRKFQMMSTLALGSVPLVVLLFAYSGHSHLSYAWIYPIVYLVFSMIGLLVNKKIRLLYGILFSTLTLAFCFLFFSGSELLPVLAAVLLYVLLFLWSISMASWPSGFELPVLVRFVLFGVHIVTQYAVLADRIETKPLLTAQAAGLHLAFIGFLFLILLSMNRDSMNKASTEFRRVPQSMRRKNVIMTLVLFALACAASFIPYIYDWIKEFVVWLIGIIILLMSRQQSDPPSTATTAAPTETVAESLPVAEYQPKELSPIFEFIILAFGGLVFACVVVFLVYWLIKRVISLAGRLWGALERYAAAASEDYEDEITDTRKDAERERIAKKRRRDIIKEELQKPENPGQRIRSRYRRLLRKHPEWTADTTARENIPVDLAVLYEHARYSDNTVSEEEAERFHAGAKHI